MASSGFEGFEKRLELHFSGDDDPVNKNKKGLRLIEFESINRVLNAVQCTVVSALGNKFFDAYVLSESSLFVYPTKIIIKTCGTTQLLKSIRPLIHYANLLGFCLSAVNYTRGSFIFPNSQPYPHTSFKEEVNYIESNLPKSLCFRKASVMPSRVQSHNWHVFIASENEYNNDDYSYCTVEVCMTQLDKTLAGKFFGSVAGDVAGKYMTDVTGIGEINKKALISDYAFNPCGYSMNGMDVDKYSTIHVTPEEGYSYASFECVVSEYDHQDDVVEMLKKVVQVFRPGTMSIAMTSCDNRPEVWARIVSGLEPMGLKCRSCSMDDFPSVGTILYQAFTSRRK